MGEGIRGAKERDLEPMALGAVRSQPHCGKVTRPQGGARVAFKSGDSSRPSCKLEKT